MAVKQPDRPLKEKLAENCRKFRALLLKTNRQGKKVPYSRDDLAEKAGIHACTLERIEHAQNEVTLSTLELLARGLNRSPTELLR